MQVPKGEASLDIGEAQYPMTAVEEKIAIQEILEATESQTKEGDLHYLISCRWWRQWYAYVGDGASSYNYTEEPSAVYSSKSGEEASTNPKRPSTIDNSDLVINLTKEDYIVEHELKDSLAENRDYILMPEQVWIAFHKWYGGGPVISRKVISTGSANEDSLMVEVYPLLLNLTVNPNGNELTLRISKKDTVGKLHHKARELFNLGSEQIRIWDYFRKRKQSLMTDHEQTLQDAGIQMDHDILLEVQVDGSWPEDRPNSPDQNGRPGNELALVPVELSQSNISIAGGPSVSRKSANNSTSDLDYIDPLNNSFEDLDGGPGISSSSVRTGPLGLTGLLNLGNTCFMNSALQCLAHTPELVQFFLRDYSQEINRYNPLGMEGELAIAFGELLRKLWAPGRAPIAPRAFNAKLGRFAPQFSGYNQHDSQELLAFLLDGLHEDLNRVKLKPYLESKNVDGRSDEEVAQEYWENHKARNDSIIVDICQGQYKSTLVCPVCSKVSVTFDPFMYLSLPLPTITTRTMTITVFTSDGSAPPTPYTVTLPKQGKGKDLIEAIGKACNLRNAERLLIAELYNHRSFRILEDPLQLLNIRDDDHVVAYRLPKIAEKNALLIFTHRRPDNNKFVYQGSRAAKSFGVPLVTCISTEVVHTGSDLSRIFQKMIKSIRKAEPPVQVLPPHENGHDNGCHPDSDQNSNLGSFGCKEGWKCEGEVGEPSEVYPNPFQLWFPEDRTLRETLIEDVDKPLPNYWNLVRNSKVHITVEWSDLAFNLYDAQQLDGFPEVHKSDLPVKKVRHEAVSLYTCLEAFLKEEPLGPEDMWLCPLCKEHRQASKKLDLWRLPEILVVHLKRFSYSKYSKNKLETYVHFPLHDLDLTKYIARKDAQVHLYQLYAVSNHYGNMGAGHYTAYAKLIDDKRWYNFDDSHVSPISEEEIKTSAAYVLFYRKVWTQNGNSSNAGPKLSDCKG